MRMQPIKTDPEILKRLERATGRAMTPREKFEQRVSFVYGQQDFGNPNPRSKEQIRQTLIESGYGYPGMPA